jgi:hypothetical protein
LANNPVRDTFNFCGSLASPRVRVRGQGFQVGGGRKPFRALDKRRRLRRRLLLRLLGLSFEPSGEIPICLRIEFPLLAVAERRTPLVSFFIPAKRFPAAPPLAEAMPMLSLVKYR